MKMTLQNPAFHGEGDVLAHTKMVCSALTATPDFYDLPEIQQTELFLAAALHDIGKVRTTRLEEGSWTAPRHAAIGSRMVREFLWKECGICGRKDLIVFRETVCALIRWHMLPMHLMNHADPERMLRKTASEGELAEDFSWHLLCLLAKADIRGRIAEDMDEVLLGVELAETMAEETGCLYRPFPFNGSFIRHAYLSGRNVMPDQMLYDASWGEVIMMSGLPGTGKDTWIRSSCPDLPMISLDRIREELKISPADRQGAVLKRADELARNYLRKKQPFVWNATNLTRDTRRKLIRLFEGYGARTRIVYLETDLETEKARNRGRSRNVPEEVIDRMLKKTVPPVPEEAYEVEWICV